MLLTPQLKNTNTMANLQKTIEQPKPIRFLHGSKLMTTYDQSTFNNAVDGQSAVTILSEEEYQIALGKTEYRLMYQVNGIRVERFDRGFPIGIEYRISDDNRLHAFATSINPMSEYGNHKKLLSLIDDDLSKADSKLHEFILTLIDDSIEMDIDKVNGECDHEFESREFEL